MSSKLANSATVISYRRTKPSKIILIAKINLFYVVRIIIMVNGMKFFLFLLQLYLFYLIMLKLMLSQRYLEVKVQLVLITQN